MHYDIHGRTFCAPSSAFSVFHVNLVLVPTFAAGHTLDQQQLQIARAARWHQTAATDPSAPLRTLDDAALWLNDVGFCLFLPRHAQLPAPAPSFVEACMGTASATPPQAAIAPASELLARLVSERQVIPLNMLGSFSEQPDFLVTTEVLPWVVAIRGDRQWKTAPAGRTTPLVIRTFEALDREGELTAIEIREILGREITEGAALRALVELWTGLRAMPIYIEGAPTRWTLLKNRFAAQMATAANTGQTTALSAVVSLYLRSAVAATAEEAEIFLSPLTSRSRIREVLHGMMATRQIATTPVATHTMLFLEGSLPETALAPEPEAAKPDSGAAPAASAARPPFRKGPRPTRWELPARDARPRTEERRPWQKKPAAPHRAEPGGERPRREARPFAGTRPRFDAGPGQRSGGPGSKPWKPERKGSFRDKAFGNRKFVPPEREASAEGPAAEARPPRRQPWTGSRTGGRTGPGAFRGNRPGGGNRGGERPGGQRPAFGGKRPGAGGSGEGKPPWQKRAGGQKAGGPTAGGPASFRKDRRKDGEAPGKRPWQPRPAFGGKPASSTSGGGEGKRPWQKRPAGAAPFRKDRKRDGEAPGKGPWKPRPAFGGKPAAGGNGEGKPPWQKRTAGGQRAGGPAPFRKDRKKDGETEGRRPWRDRPAPRGERPEGSAPSGEARPERPSSTRPARPFRPGKPFAGKPNRPGSGGARPGRFGPPKNKFRKPSPAERKPRKNRSQKETPE